MGLVFGGADTINCGSDATIDSIWAGGGTIATWVHFSVIDSANQNMIAAKWPGWYWSAVEIAAVDTMRFYVDYTGSSDSYWQYAAPSIGAWHHMVVAYNSDTTANQPALYIDGTAAPTTQLTNSTGALADDSAATFFVGDFLGDFSNALDGNLEDFRAFGRVLSAVEVSLLAAGYRGPLGGEMLWYAAVGISGEAASSDAASVIDKTINKNHGTPHGGMFYSASIAPRY